MKLKSDILSQNRIGVFLDPMREFLLKNDCDSASLQVTTIFNDGKCICTDICFVYFIDKVENSCDFDEIYEGDAHRIVSDCFSPFNSNMSSVSGVLWDFMIIKVYKSGEVYVKFFYNTSLGDYINYDFSP
ncbi:hypothetical protein [Bombella favorum]|uniref:Uncharacterized protein n=1 Tax=Bombella favorum TaxID=2039164 RepID=A0ABR5ZPS3_9PROT|nr:hypothetical protein [Bombella favorum]MBA5726333.1 hypothetical protein [Bombella favorum]